MQTFKSRRAARGVETDPVARIDQLTAHVDQQFLEVERAAAAESDSSPLRYLAVAPSKPKDGIYLSAAGVLGVSRGAYRYDSEAGTYTFLA